MENPVLDSIKAFAVKALTDAYGDCGLAEGSDKAIIKSNDGEGKDIRINITTRDEA